MGYHFSIAFKFFLGIIMSERRIRLKLKTPILLCLLYGILSGFILAFSSGGFLVNFKQLGFSVVSSVQKGASFIANGVTGFFTAVGDLATLREDYEKLQEMLEDYEYLQRNNADIKKENARLKEQLGFSTEYQYKNYPAQIISRDPNALYNGITLNKGSRHNVRKGMAVLAIQNGNIGLVGKVVSVGIETSMIMPIYDYQCSISARISSTRDIGLVSGNGDADGNLTLKYIKKRVLEELNLGDVIVTSGETENYIKDIPIGSISNIKMLDYDNSLEIEITPIIDFSRLENVIIVDSSQFQNQ
jgi:rod shape-determining protein MreC